MRFNAGFFLAIFAVTIWAGAATAAEAPDAVSCTSVKTSGDLQKIKNDLAGSYCIDADIDAGSISNFKPIGQLTTPFTGRIYGNGHVIRNLTINDSADTTVGLIGAMTDGVIQDLGLLNVNVTGTNSVVSYNGGLVGLIEGVPGSSVTIARVYVTGNVSCVAGTGGCIAGGITAAILENATLEDSWSSADVTSNYAAGGVAGVIEVDPATVIRTYATGNVTCPSTSTSCLAVGGLTAAMIDGSAIESYATGEVTGAINTLAGGLVGEVQETTVGAIVLRTYATGAVHVGGGTAEAGALVGDLSGDGSVISQSYAVGKVTGDPGATLGGLVAKISSGTPTVTDSYWDTDTTAQATSAAGTGETTDDLQTALPTGFGGAWGISANLSYPFLNDPDAFSSTLATLVHSNKIYAFLPISQLDTSQYHTTPKNDDASNGEAALATDYTMIARAIGLTDMVSQLKDVAIDKYFWDDSKEKATFQGPVKSHADLGSAKAVSKGTSLSAVISAMNGGKLVILRGTYTNGKKTDTHFVLATLYLDASGSPSAILADDSWTGTQIEIDPNTKKVIAPADFPLADFTIDQYQTVTIH